jgi:hypothetical protein
MPGKRIGAMKHAHDAALEALGPLLVQRELCVENLLVVVVLAAASALVASGQLGSDCGHGLGALLRGDGLGGRGVVELGPDAGPVVWAQVLAPYFALCQPLDGHAVHGFDQRASGLPVADDALANAEGNGELGDASADLGGPRKGYNVRWNGGGL